MTTQLSPPDRQPEKPDLQPPDAGEDIPRKGNLLFVLMVAFTLFVLLDIAIIAYFFLVHRSEKVKTPVQQERHFVEKTNPSVVENVDVGQSPDSDSLRAVEEKRRAWLKLQAMAEADDIRAWGEMEFTVIIDIAAEGERFLADKQTLRADALFQQAMDALKTLLASQPALLAEAIEAGNAALTAGNSAAAVEAFIRAQALSSADQQAVHGLERARILDQVLALYQKGLDAEEQENLKAAQALLLEANTLDPEFLPASEALHRVQSQREELEFKQAMGGFLKALTDGKTAEAKNELTRAAGLRPQSPAVIEGQNQLQQLILRQTLARLHNEHIRFAQSEQWQQAKERCEQALTIDPQAAFAVVGLREVIRRLDLDRALQAILEQPQRLQEEDVLQAARQTLVLAESVTEPGPRLQGQLTAVKRQLQAASLQVPVVLRSDNETEVVIYRIGRQGKFNRRELRLRPGQYTILGSRPGYRDVRKVLDIRAEDEEVQLDIDCREVI